MRTPLSLYRTLYQVHKVWFHYTCINTLTLVLSIRLSVKKHMYLYMCMYICLYVWLCIILSPPATPTAHEQVHVHVEPQTGQKEVSSGEDLEPRSPTADPSAPPPPEGEARSSGLPRPGAEREDAHDQRVEEAPAHLEPVQTDTPVPPTFAANVPPGSDNYSDGSMLRDNPQGRDEGAVAGQSMAVSNVVQQSAGEVSTCTSAVGIRGWVGVTNSCNVQGCQQCIVRGWG